jgi:hypothetical protein
MSNLQFSRLWAGLYNPSADYLLPATYSDGTPFNIGDVKVDFFPDYIFGSETENYKLRFLAAFCPTYRYQGNLDAIVSLNFTETDNVLPLYVACIGLIKMQIKIKV